MKLLSLILGLFAAPAFAQDAALVINCGTCNAFQGIEVLIDGAPVNTGNIQSSVRVEVSPGDHEVKAIKWNSPFSRDELASGVLKFPKGVELRVRADAGKLNVYGRGKLEPAPPAGPSADALRAAGDLISEARDYLKEAIEYNDDEESKCQSKVSAKLEILDEGLKELGGELDPVALKKTTGKAGEAQSFIESHCPGRVSASLGKKLGKVVARLEKARAELR